MPTGIYIRTEEMYKSRKGKHPSPSTEFKKRHPATKGHKGRHHSESTRKKMSESRRGKIGYWKGKHFTEEHKRKVSIALKGKKKPPFSVIHKQKLREVNLGKKHSHETKRKISASHQGISINKWQGFVTAEDYRIRYSPEYAKWKRSVLRRDNHQCRKCGNYHSPEIHHLKSFALYPELRLEVSNGIVLCRECHKETKTGVAHYYGPKGIIEI